MPTKVSPFSGPHFVRYGTAADQKYLVGELGPTYDHLVINANMLAHMKAAFSYFVSQKVKKPFFIDPQTHAFQHDISYLQSASKEKEGEIKKSIKALLSAYGDPVETKI